MKTIKTGQKLLEFNGKVMVEKSNENPIGKEVVIGTVLANVMGASTSNPSLAWQLGKKFATEETVELKAEDVVFVKKSIEEASTGERRWLMAIVAGQLLEELDKSDNEKKNNKE